MSIRAMTKADFESFWSTFLQIVKEQESYTYSPDIDFEEAYEIWCKKPMRTFIYEKDGKICGSYYIKNNTQSLGKNVCNCGYMVAPNFRNQGIATMLCNHSQNVARELGFKAMQFNAVISTNVVAVYLWKKLGFEIIERLPNAFLHKNFGYVDCYIMYKEL
ncbi:MAG: GNAT family N-acetyltransferase [Campylobacterales bacterium]|nr:GNAT family N-acetyltransferase [Campylobacterales bacterium]